MGIGQVNAKSAKSGQGHDAGEETERQEIGGDFHEGEVMSGPNPCPDHTTAS